MRLKGDYMWINDMPDSGEFSRVSVEVEGILDDAEVNRAAGCVGYAFKEYLHGESLGEPEGITRANGRTVFECYYDSTKCHRYDVYDALCAAEEYILEGTPRRKTDRTGPVGTRLVEGVGRQASVFVNAPESVLRQFNVLVNGNPDQLFYIRSSPGAVVTLKEI
jgi:hypothetical protein